MAVPQELPYGCCLGCVLVSALSHLLLLHHHAVAASTPPAFALPHPCVLPCAVGSSIQTETCPFSFDRHYCLNLQLSFFYSMQVFTTPKWCYTAHIDDSDAEDAMYGPATAFTAADLARLVSCCPALQKCTLCIQSSGLLRLPAVQLTPFVSVPTLRELDVQGVEPSGMRSLASVTQLRSLRVKTSVSVNFEAVVGLSELRALTLLSVDMWAVQPDELVWGPEDIDYAIREIYLETQVSPLVTVYYNLAGDCTSVHHYNCVLQGMTA